MIKTAGATVALFALAFPAQGQETGLFNTIELSAAHTVRDIKTVNFFKSNEATLIARGEDQTKQRYFSFYKVADEGRMSPKPDLELQMPKEAIFFDYAPIFDENRESLLFLTAGGVQIYNLENGMVEPLVELSSIYQQNGSPLFNQKDFARDLNGDGYGDLLLPDFAGYRLRLNDGKGGFGNEQLLNMHVEMRLFETTPRYSQFPVYSFDVNFDGLKDIVFHKDNSFLAFLQKADGTYRVNAQTYSFDIDIVGNSFAAQVASNERYSDQSDLAETNVSAVRDINGDGVMDIVTQTDRAKGLFNRSSEFGFHYGFETNKTLAFNKIPTATIVMKGITANIRHIDFGTDGRLDFAGGAVSVGIGKIIGILLSGSVGIPVMFYEQGPDGQFNEDPSFRKKISVDFDMSSGQSSVPVVEMTDIDGDGNKDLILGKDTEELRIYMATPGTKKMFEKKPIKVVASLPKNGEQVVAADLNSDGKGDLILFFDRLGADGEANRNKLIVLMAK